MVVFSIVFGSVSGVVVVSGLYTFSHVIGSWELSAPVEPVKIVHWGQLISALNSVPEGNMVVNTK